MKNRLSRVESGLALNTKILQNTNDRLGTLVDSTEPYVKLRQAVVKSGERAKALGRYTTATVDWLLKWGKVGAMFIGAVVLWRALANGESPVEALKIIWQIIVAH